MMSTTAIDRDRHRAEQPRHQRQRHRAEPNPRRPAYRFYTNPGTLPIAGPQGASSRPMWETLEGMVREKAQEFIQQIMEEEVTELLGREKSERRSTVDSAEG